jgi:hypothetical protein
VTPQDELEQQLRIDQMTINIEKIKHDMKWDARRFAVQIILALAAAVAAGVALGKLLFGA